MRTINLTNLKPESQIISLVEFNTLKISCFSGEECMVFFMDLYERKVPLELEQPQEFNLRELSKIHGVDITKVQFCRISGDCRFVCERL